MSDRAPVLVAIKGLGIGGAEKLISEAAPLWDRRQFAYHVAYFVPWKDQLVSEVRGHDVPVTFVGGRRGMGPGSAASLRRLSAEIGAALVHVHSPAVAVLARLTLDVPIVYTEHNLASSYRQPTRTLNRLTYARNAAVIAVSEAVADSLGGFPGPAPRVIRNGVSCSVTGDERSAVRHELGITDDRPLIVHVGNIRPHKGHRNLLAAAQLLRETVHDALIVSIGVEKHDGDLDALRREADQSNVSGSVRFLGRRPDARAFLAAADVVVNPSDVEGLPIAVLEAMALARPIAATGVGGVPAVIRDGETGRLVPAADPVALADAIGDLLSDRQLARQLGHAARDLVEQDFSLTAMVRNVEEVYREVLDGG